MDHVATLRRDDDGFYWHLSRPGRPGEESERFDSMLRAIHDFIEHGWVREANTVIRIPADLK